MFLLATHRLLAEPMGDRFTAPALDRVAALRLIWAMRTSTCVCVDIAGTLLSDVLGPPLPEALESVARLREEGYAVRFVTNTTSLSPKQLAEHLRELGVLEDAGELYTPFTTAKRALMARGAASGLLIADDAQRAELSWFEQRADGASVLLTTEAHALTIADLQPAFRALLDGAQLYIVAKNRYFEQHGELVTDVGAVAALLEYASETTAHVLGKPSQLLFETIAADVGMELTSLVMVGDDAEFDVARCMELGLRGVLVRTGKYRKGDESRHRPRPTGVVDSLSEVVGILKA